MESSLKVRKYGWICILFFMVLLPLYKETSFVYTTGISLWKSDVAVKTHILIDLYRYAIGLLGSVTVIYIVYILSGQFKTLDNMLSKCGQYTMQIYVVQCFFFKIFGIVWEKMKHVLGSGIILLNAISRDVMVALPSCLILLLALLFISKVFEKSSRINRILFGR